MTGTRIPVILFFRASAFTGTNGINQGKKLERRMTGTRIPVILFFRASAFTGTNWWDWSGR